MNRDDLIRRAFDALRTEDELRAPSFEGIVARIRRPLRSATQDLTGIVVSALVIFAAIFVSEFGRRLLPSVYPDRTPSILSWRAPTDFLLDTPASQLMRSIPQLGRPIVLEPLRPVTPSAPMPRPISMPEGS